ncbi:hypothetical protein CSUI_007809, partial [Cystoisospora suis]
RCVDIYTCACVGSGKRVEREGGGESCMHERRRGDKFIMRGSTHLLVEFSTRNSLLRLL